MVEVRRKHTYDAGRPQFEDSAVAVIMCQRDQIQRYQELSAGLENIESRLPFALVEFLNAEIAMRTITSHSQVQGTSFCPCIS